MRHIVRVFGRTSITTYVFIQNYRTLVYASGVKAHCCDTDASRADVPALHFLVVQVIFMSETARFANVVLPGASFFEKSGTFTNGERRVQRVKEVIPPLAGTTTDGQIVSAS